MVLLLSSPALQRPSESGQQSRPDFKGNDGFSNQGQLTVQKGHSGAGVASDQLSREDGVPYYVVVSPPPAKNRRTTPPPSSISDDDNGDALLNARSLNSSNRVGGVDQVPVNDDEDEPSGEEGELSGEDDDQVFDESHLANHRLENGLNASNLYPYPPSLAISRPYEFRLSSYGLEMEADDGSGNDDGFSDRASSESNSLDDSSISNSPPSSDVSNSSFESNSSGVSCAFELNRRWEMYQLSISKINSINASPTPVSLCKSVLVYNTLKQLQRDLHPSEDDDDVAVGDSIDTAANDDEMSVNDLPTNGVVVFDEFCASTNNVDHAANVADQPWPSERVYMEPASDANSAQDEASQWSSGVKWSTNATMMESDKTYHMLMTGGGCFSSESVSSSESSACPPESSNTDALSFDPLTHGNFTHLQLMFSSSATSGKDN